MDRGAGGAAAGEQAARRATARRVRAATFMAAQSTVQRREGERERERDGKHSDEGARIAVAVAVDALAGAAARLGANERDVVASDILTKLRRRVAFEWNRRVKHHARMIAARDGLALLWPEEVTGDWDERVKALWLHTGRRRDLEGPHSLVPSQRR